MKKKKNKKNSLKKKVNKEGRKNLVIKIKEKDNKKISEELV
jgi:hypothetical protein